MTGFNDWPGCGIGDGGIESWYIGVGGCSGRSSSELTFLRVKICQ